MPGGALTSGSGASSCHFCGQCLLGRYYQLADGTNVCATCYRDRPRCARCGAPLDDATLASLKRLPVGEPQLCGPCLRSAPRCAACQRQIGRSWYSFEELLSPDDVRQFCAQCMQQRPRCDVCGVPVGSDGRRLDDGQQRCPRCAAEMVVTEAAMRAAYTDVLDAVRALLGEALRQVPPLEVVSRQHMADVRRRNGQHPAHGASVPASGVVGHHVLGCCVRSRGKCVIYVERGLPRCLLLGTLAHELGHAWQGEHAPGVDDPLECEGFAEWVAYHVLLARGLRSMAARATRRDDIYGRGLRHLLQVERNGGRAAVLQVVRRDPGHA